MKTKTYIATKATSLGLAILTKDKKRLYCKFINGKTYPVFEGGKFRTNKPVEQEAIETHPAYGDLFILDGESYTPDPWKEVVIPGGLPPGDIGVTDELVYHVGNMMEARKWLKENKGAKNADLVNTKAIDKYCEKVKVVFPDWLTNRGD